MTATTLQQLTTEHLGQVVTVQPRNGVGNITGILTEVAARAIVRTPALTEAGGRVRISVTLLVGSRPVHVDDLPPDTEFLVDQATRPSR